MSTAQRPKRELRTYQHGDRKPGMWLGRSFTCRACEDRGWLPVPYTAIGRDHPGESMHVCRCEIGAKVPATYARCPVDYWTDRWGAIRTPATTPAAGPLFDPEPSPAEEPPAPKVVPFERPQPPDPEPKPQERPPAAVLESDDWSDLE